MIDFEYSKLCRELEGKKVEFSVSFEELYMLLASVDSMLASPQVEDYGKLFEAFVHGVRLNLLQGLRDLGLTEEQITSLDEYSRVEDDVEIKRDKSHLSIVGSGEEEG